MGHAWPGGAAVDLGDPTAPLTATDLLWQFFAEHPRRK
jgi:polyhydroxybutyrate depolymerase